MPVVLSMTSERLQRFRTLFLPANAPRVHGMSMAFFLLLSLIYDIKVIRGLIVSGGHTWSTITSLPWLLAYLISSMAGGLAGLDLALLRRRGLQRQVMFTLAVMLLIQAPTVALLNPILSGQMHRFHSLNSVGIAAFVSAAMILAPMVMPSRLQALNGGQRNPDSTAVHHSQDKLGEQLSDWMGYVLSGGIGAVLMIVTGIALTSPVTTFERLFTTYPMLPNFLGMAFVNGSLCVALAAFAATLRDRRIISEPTEKGLMLLPVLLFVVGLNVIPWFHPAMAWIVPANRDLIVESLMQL